MTAKAVMRRPRKELTSNGADRVSSKVEKLSEQHVDEEDEGYDEDEKLVMVMMPRVAYDAFQDLARKNDKSVAETMSLALAVLSKKLEGKDEP